MGSVWSGSLAIKIIATTRQSNLAASNNTNKIFTALSLYGTSAIHANSNQSPQVTSKYTNNMFTILTLSGTSAIHANTKPSKQATSNNTNEIFTTSTSFGTNAKNMTTKPSKHAPSNNTSEENTNKPKHKKINFSTVSLFKIINYYFINHHYKYKCKLQRRSLLAELHPLL